MGEKTQKSKGTLSCSGHPLKAIFNRKKRIKGCNTRRPIKAFEGGGEICSESTVEIQDPITRTLGESLRID